MQLNIYRSLWGWQGDRGRCVRELRTAGCNGIEARFPVADREARLSMRRWLERESLDYIAVVFSGGDVLPRQADTPEQHLAYLDRALNAAADLKPRFVNVLAGNDRWPLARQIDFFGRAHALAERHGVLCSFETHRGSSLYSPWVTLDIIQALPDLRFTADISHWVVVCERLLDDPLDALDAFVERVHHIQARVGYAQGPQVPHPGAPEYAGALDFHQRFWERLWQAQIERGYRELTLTPEFGPDGYLHHLPFTDVPVADLWALNAWMALEERAHFDRYLSQQTRPERSQGAMS